VRRGSLLQQWGAVGDKAGDGCAHGWHVWCCQDSGRLDREAAPVGIRQRGSGRHLVRSRVLQEDLAGWARPISIQSELLTWS
jgi:hypothetical protein